MILDFNLKKDGYNEKLITIRRSVTVVKGGRRFNFSALMVIGNGKGKIGIGFGKAKEVPIAIQKAIENAKRNIHYIELKKGTLFHVIRCYHGASTIIMLPASKGTGIIANTSIRTIFEVIGINNIFVKCIGSTNPINVTIAVLKGLKSMITPSFLKKKRGKMFID